MSKYTTELRYICERAAGLDESVGFDDVKNVLEQAAPVIFDFDFPIFDEAYRLPLEIKILRHYYTREIAAETVGLWKLWLEDKMNIIMPYYNQLYRSELLEFNPLYDVDITRDHTKDVAGEGENAETTTSERDRTDVTDGTTVGTGNTTDTSTRQGSDTSNRWDLYSDTPQGGLNGLIDDDDPLTVNNYLTNARRNIDSNAHNETINASGTTSNQTDVDTTVTTNDDFSGSTSGTNSFTNTEDYLEHVRGKQGGISYSKMLTEFRETFLNIDKMIINELAELFFNLW